MLAKIITFSCVYFFRRERGNCRICWSTIAATDFQVSGPNSKMRGVILVPYFSSFNMEVGKLFSAYFRAQCAAAMEMMAWESVDLIV